MSAARFDLPRRLLAEVLGTAFLLATVVGSGIMAENLAGQRHEREQHGQWREQAEAARR